MYRFIFMIMGAPFVVLTFYWLVLEYIHTIFDVNTDLGVRGAYFAASMLTLLVAIGIAVFIVQIYEKRNK